ncbi:MAG: hypothetical protein IPK26_21300 [Planctomycetes bacterium]|nr:hypothetical protein [Planctomycetota bacterium]
MNRSVPSSAFLLLSLFATAPACLIAQDKIDLAVTSTKNLALWFQETQVMEQVIDFGGQQHEVGSTTHHVLSVAVEDIDSDGRLHLAIKIERIHGAMQVPMMGDVEFDSAKAKEGDEDEDGGGMFGMGNMTKALTAAAGHSFKAVVGRDGKVVELTDTEKLLAATKKTGGAMAGPGGDTNESTLQRRVESLFGPRPAEPVAVGGKWQHSVTDSDGQFAMAVNSDVTLTKVDGDQVVLESTGTASKTEKPAGKEPATKNEGDQEEGNEMQREMFAAMKIENSKAMSRTTLSRKEGFIVSGNNETSMTMKMPSPMGSGEMNIDVKFKTTIARTTPDLAMPKAEPKKDAAPAAGTGK